jgi:hypothetical protein
VPARRLQVAQVPGMQDVEDAVGEDDAFADRTRAAHERLEGVSVQHL